METLDLTKPLLPLACDPKERRILEAARALFLELGYASTSMDQVAQRAQASKTTLYTRFPSKQALFEATIRAECEASGMDFSPGDFAGMPVATALHRIGRRFIDLVHSPSALRMEQVVQGEAARFPEVALTLQREGPDRVIAAVTAYLDHAIGDGALDLPDPRFAARYFLMALKGGGLCAGLEALPSTPAEKDAHVEKAVALFLHGALPRGCKDQPGRFNVCGNAASASISNVISACNVPK
jgi:TetR/AcrR family transcriptional repressor of mexJK operon